MLLLISLAIVFRFVFCSPSFKKSKTKILHFLYFVQDTESAGKNASSRVKSRLPATDDSEPSQSDTITYDDPAGRMEREKIIAQLKRGASPSTDCNTEEDEENRRKVSCTLSLASERLVQGGLQIATMMSFNTLTKFGDFVEIFCQNCPVCQSRHIHQIPGDILPLLLLRAFLDVSD